MTAAFERLHMEGWAHSVETWEDGELIGGVYGLCVGGVFFGESMFSGRTNASKMALVGLTHHMLDKGLEIIDCQIVSQHLMSLGAEVIPRSEFTAILQRACDPPRRHECWPAGPVPVAETLRS